MKTEAWGKYERVSPDWCDKCVDVSKSLGEMRAIATRLQRCAKGSRRRTFSSGFAKGVKHALVRKSSECVKQAVNARTYRSFEEVAGVEDELGRDGLGSRCIGRVGDEGGGSHGRGKW